jgi:hypothetical protein
MSLTPARLDGVSAHSRGSQEARVAVRRKTIKLRVAPALERVMEPGDRIIAGMSALTGLPPPLDLAVSLPVVALSFESIGARRDVIALLGGLASWLLSVVLLFSRRPVFVAVTERQLICCRLSRIGSEPTRLLFCAPLITVSMISVGRGALRWRSVRYSGPGAEGPSLRLNVRGRWRRDLDEVLIALHAGGAAVPGVPLAARHARQVSGAPPL